MKNAQGKPVIVTETETNYIALTKSGKTTHQLMKEYAANKFETNEFDRLFDRAYEFGTIYGTAFYDECIDKILGTIGITNDEIMEMITEELL